MSGVMFVHMFALESYAQVSLRKPELPWPPNKTVRSDWESYAIACPYRPGGVRSVPPVPAGARGIGVARQLAAREAMGRSPDECGVLIPCEPSPARPIATKKTRTPTAAGHAFATPLSASRMN